MADGRWQIKKNLNKPSGFHPQSAIRNLRSSFVNDVAASFQNAAVTWLVEKSLQLADEKQVGDVVVGGGVSANSELRKRLPEEGAKRGIKIWFPPFALTTDNAAMIARRGAELFRRGRRSKLTLAAQANLKMGR
jgi:N6-L-threonylcarbamoyladenine synthase